MDTKLLKQKILDLAIRGKLVPQNPNDEPASELLKRIHAEKEKLIAEGKIKRPKNAADKLPYRKLETSEAPFEIPESWEWVRLCEIFSMQAGKNISSHEISTCKTEKYIYPCYGGNGLRGYAKTFNNEGVYPIVGRQGALCGNVNMASGKFYATEHAVTVDGKENFSARFLFYILKMMNLNQYKSAGAQPGLSVAKLNTVTIVVPPLPKQERIVAILDRFDELVNDLSSGLPAELNARRKQYGYYRGKLLSFK